MRLLVAAITFAMTIGGLFLFENYKTRPPEENYAQIIQELKNRGQNNTAAPKPLNQSGKTPTKLPTQSKIQTTVSPSGSPTLSFTTAPAITPQSSPPSPPTATPAPSTSSGFPASTPTTTPILTSTPQPSPQNDQIIVISLTSPVKQNSTAKLDIKTLPEAQCAIKVTLPSGSQSTAGGLEAKIADNSGAITWSWKINWNTTPGTANIDLTCSKDGQGFSKSLQMIIIER